MKKILYNIVQFCKINFLRYFGKNIDKLAINISDEYYYLLKNNNIHHDVISKIIKNIKSENQDIEGYNKFIYSTKLVIDKQFLMKYGKSGNYLIELFKLILKVYMDNLPQHKEVNYTDELEKAIVGLNKNFNKIALYMFEKNFNE